MFSVCRNMVFAMLFMAQAGCDDPNVQKFISDVKDDPSIKKLISDVKVGMTVANKDIQVLNCEEDVKEIARGGCFENPSRFNLYDRKN